MGLSFASLPVCHHFCAPGVSHGTKEKVFPSEKHLSLQHGTQKHIKIKTLKNVDSVDSRLSQINTDVHMLCLFTWDNISDNALESEFVIAHVQPDDVEKPAV